MPSAGGGINPARAAITRRTTLRQNNCPGGGGPGGEFVLTGDPDPWNPGEVASYVQLFEPHYYVMNDNGEWIVVTDPATECPNGIEGDLSVEPLAGVCIAQRLMSARGAIASARFFRLFDDDTDDDAYEVELRYGYHEGSVRPQRLAHARGTAVDRRMAGHRCPLL